MWIGISLGDMGGIGPEVTLKALAADAGEEPFRYLLIGNATHVRSLAAELGIKLPIQDFNNYDAPGRFFVHDPFPEPLLHEHEPGSPLAALVAVKCLREGAARCLKRDLAALVTAPVNKESIIRSGQTFVGQTEFLSEMAATSRTAMMLLGHDDRGRWLRVVLATTHIPLKFVADQLTQSKVEQAIELASEACRQLDLPRSRVGVCGLNPHAGEGGKVGDEELTIIRPAIDAVRARKLDVEGPMSADTLFYRVFRGDFDAVVAMYHDQGLVPLKMVAFENGVNWTLGLPFIRTSPDHGTAYDIAPRRCADPSSMRAALRLARQLALRQKRSH
jgi:4-hydroxythreonine-4-phosphate dehydrogenase